jgi:hypothetical protein
VLQLRDHFFFPFGSGLLDLFLDLLVGHPRQTTQKTLKTIYPGGSPW